MNDEKQTWFITGTSSGFGRSMTKKLLRRGDRVAATLRKPAALADLQAQYGEQLWVAPLDVTDTAAIHRVMAEAFEQLGRIDVVVSNAGYALFGAAEELESEQILQQIATNLTGSIELIRAALPHLRAQGGGRIIQVSSEGGQIAYPSFSLYHATKWGIEGFIEAVAQEVAPFGIEFTLIEPGPAKTEFGAGLVEPPSMPVYEQTPVGEMRRALKGGAFKLLGDPNKMAQAILDSVEIHPAPLRLTLGSSSYDAVKKALNARLENLEQLKEITLSTDADD